MTNYSVRDVDEYIAASPTEAHSHLKEIRAAVHSAAPQAEEKIGYGKPYYKHHRWIVGFDVYKHHIGFEIWDGQLSSQVRKDLEENGYKTGSKTFQIRYDQPVPTTIIKDLTKRQVQAEEKKHTNKE